MTSGILTRSRVPLSEWTIISNPAAATRASAVLAAGGAGVRRVMDGFTVSVSPVAAQGHLLLQIRDGASLAGVIIWELGMIVPLAAGSLVFGLSDLGLIGSANTAMTIEFNVAPAAGNFQRVNALGYNVT
jgi:hypothetical protein